MRTDLPLASHTLPRGAMHRIDDGRGLLVQCLGGRLWLTQEGDPRDIVLDAGGEARIDRDGLSILTALRDARFVVLGPAGAAGAARDLH